MMKSNSFFKVIVLKIDVFGSDIVDERHFATRDDAGFFMSRMKKEDLLPVLVEI